MAWSEAERAAFRAELRRGQVVPREPGRPWVPVGMTGDGEAFVGDPSGVVGYELYAEWSEAKRERFEADVSYVEAVRLVREWNAARDEWARKRQVREVRLALQSAVFVGDGTRRRPGLLLRDLQCATDWSPGDPVPAQVRWNVERRAAPVLKRRKATELERYRFPVGRRPGEGRLCESRAWRWRRVLEVQVPPGEAESARRALAEEIRMMTAPELLEVMSERRVNLWDPELRFADFLVEHGLSVSGLRVVR